MKPRTGRPISGNPWQMRVETKITAEELKKLDYCCKASEKTWSEIIREDVDIVYVRLNKIK